MKYIFFLFSLPILLFSCQEKKADHENAEGVATKAHVEIKPVTVDPLRMKLLGLWGGKDGPIWEIKTDSIYYFNESKAYPYKLINGDFVIYRTNITGTLWNISVSGDTLKFDDEQGLPVRGYRCRKSK